MLALEEKKIVAKGDFENLLRSLRETYHQLKLAFLIGISVALAYGIITKIPVAGGLVFTLFFSFKFIQSVGWMGDNERRRAAEIKANVCAALLLIGGVVDIIALGSWLFAFISWFGSLIIMTILCMLIVYELYEMLGYALINAKEAIVEI